MALKILKEQTNLASAVREEKWRKVFHPADFQKETRARLNHLTLSSEQLCVQTRCVAQKAECFYTGGSIKPEFFPQQSN